MAKSSQLEKDDLYKVRHSAAHVMAQAVMEMFPGQARIAIGPPIEDGFYYDFELPRGLTPEDLEVIEKRMRQIIGGRHPFLRREVSADEARALFNEQPYKLELIAGLAQGGVDAVSYTHLRAHETVLDLVCRLLLEKKTHKRHK